MHDHLTKLWASNIAIFRRNIRDIQDANSSSSALRSKILRKSRLLKATGNIFDAKRADALEAKERAIFEAGEPVRVALRNIGQSIMRHGHDIDKYIPQSMLMDLLEINTTDRNRVEPTDGIIGLTFVKGLEDSACNRGNDFKCGPIASAIQAFINYQMIHDKELKNSMENHLFGKGGMFEFLPSYRRTAKGEFIKNQPKLRLADPEVDKAA